MLVSPGSLYLVENTKKHRAISRKPMNFNLESLKIIWSITGFSNQGIAALAQERLVGEIQQGLKVMSTLLILLVLGAMLFFKQMSLINTYSLNYFWVMALAAHINISARLISDIKTLHALGMTLLVISATAYVFIAHQAGGFSPLLLVNIVLLFMIIPMIPWGLREAGVVILAIYLLLTLSTLNASSHFDTENLRILQFFLLASGLTSLLLVIRSTLIRKNELTSHFELQQAHADLFTLAHLDPLTGAWNRRYTELALQSLIKDFKNSSRFFHFVIIDLDGFKSVNDTFGHEFGDRVLILFSQTILKTIGSHGYLIRIGGDEFILLLVHETPQSLIAELEINIRRQVTQDQPNAVFGMSWGLVTLPLEPVSDLESVYQSVDKTLYARKLANRKSPSQKPLNEFNN
jgi:diguanylate cyclase (GGDEF)-like protein